MEVSEFKEEQTSRGQIHIVVDDRESSSPVFAHLGLLPQVHLEVRRLATGDYEVETEWTFERKTVSDFAVSLADGRLFCQAARLARCLNGRAIILEGTDSLCLETGISREAWQGALLSLGLAFHLPVIRSASPEETARLLIYAAHQLGRSRDTIFVPGHRRARSLQKRRIQLLTSLPGVGSYRAQRLLEHFGSIEGVMRASEKELIGVRGLGSKTASRIRAFVAGGPAAEFLR